MSAVVYRRGSVADRAAVEALLAALSQESAYSRFQTALGSGPPPAVVDALLPDGPRGGTLLGWDAGRLVAHGMWVRLGFSRVAEIALVVTDSHQRRGIGSVLAERLVEAAAAAGVERVQAFSETGNRAIARMVAHGAPGAARELDGTTVTYAFGVGAPAWPRAA